MLESLKDNTELVTINSCTQCKGKLHFQNKNYTTVTYNRSNRYSQRRLRDINIAVPHIPKIIYGM